MINQINRIISKLKKESFEIDSQVPLSYLSKFFLGKIRNLIYGFFIFGKRKRCFIHPSSIVKCRKKIKYGNNLSIDRWCYIDALSSDGIFLGENVSIGKFTTIECTGNLSYLGKGLKVGNNVGLGTRGHYGCAGGVEIGNDTIIGNYVSFHSENHLYDKFDLPIRKQGVTHQGIKIGNNCWIGAKVTFLDGSSIGEGCVVAAGAVVRGKFPDNMVIGGIPAKIIKSRISI
jgi:acetyltransferase-like isoleucine patch superfamily enzyme